MNADEARTITATAIAGPPRIGKYVVVLDDAIRDVADRGGSEIQPWAWLNSPPSDREMQVIQEHYLRHGFTWRKHTLRLVLSWDASPATG